MPTLEAAMADFRHARDATASTFGL